MSRARHLKRKPVEVGYVENNRLVRPGPVRSVGVAIDRVRVSVYTKGLVVSILEKLWPLHRSAAEFWSVEA